MSHEVDVVLQVARTASQVQIPEGWGQGRATFGGLVAGILVSRALGELGVEDSLLRSVTTNFVAPASPGVATLTVEILRRGKSATQLEARLLQPDEDGKDTVRAVALMTFGAPRSSAVEILPAAQRGTKKVDDVEGIPFIQGLTPDFFAHIELLPVTGALPFSGSASGDLTGYMRFREETHDGGLAHLVTLIDGWPPAPGQMLSGPAPMSTMTWTLELVSPVSADAGKAWWYEVVTDTAHEGYAHTQAHIFDDAGELVGISRQTIALFG